MKQLDLEAYIKGREKLHGREHQEKRSDELKKKPDVPQAINSIGQEVVNNKKSLTVITGDWDLKSRIKRFEILSKNVMNQRQLGNLLEEGDDESPDDFTFGDEDFPVEQPELEKPAEPKPVPGHQQPTEPDPVPDDEPVE